MDPRARPLTLLNSGYWFAAFFALTLFAFWPSYFSKLPARVDIYTHVHAVLMTIWFGMLIAQPILIRRTRRDWHRAIGRVSYVLVPVLLVSWVLLVHVRVSAMTGDRLAQEAFFFFLPFFSAVAFLGAWGMGILRRRQTALHARYMICTGFAAADTVLGRLLYFNFPPLGSPVQYQMITFAITDLALLTLLLVDRGAARRAFAHMLAMFVVLHVLYFTVAQTQAWVAAVRWFRSLPLT
jgi:hypothetical protein